MVWQKIDDQFGVSRKVTRIPRKNRLAAIGLWELASNYAVRALTDGVLDDAELDEVMATPTLVAALVKVGLWHEAGHDCERCIEPPAGGIVIHDFLEYNPDASSVAAGRESQSEGGRHGNHVRWHTKRGVTDPSCEWCAIGDPIGNPIASVSLANPPGPVPVPKTDMTNDFEVSHVGDVAQQWTDQEKSQARSAGIKNVDAVASALVGCCGPMSNRAVVLLCQAICARARRTVTRVDGYVLTAAKSSPDDVRWEFERLDLGAIA